MKRLVVTMALCALAATAVAQEPAADREPSGEEMQKLMEMTLGPMVPMMGKMTESMIDAQLKIAVKPETAKSLALFKKNLFSELIGQGFSRKEAFEIMLNTPAPAGMPAMK